MNKSEITRIAREIRKASSVVENIATLARRHPEYAAGKAQEDMTETLNLIEGLTAQLHEALTDLTTTPTTTRKV